MTLPRHSELWLPGYVRSRLRNWSSPSPGRVWVMLADHWEPYWRRASDETAAARVSLWAREWPAIAARHADSTGRPPQYTFFYPEEEYRPAFLDTLAGLARRGIADVEVHIHHDREGEQNFLDRMTTYIEALPSRHGLLRQQQGKTVFGFIHGNWALDNSLPGGLHCGLNNEITLLRDLGCYADFTMPSGASPTQSRMVNTIYWATDDPLRPKSYDHGVPVKPGRPGKGDLLMIPGPMAIRWAERLVPRMENGELAANDPPTAYRVRRWLAVAPRIGADIFIKLHAHGAQGKNAAALLAPGGLETLFTAIAGECRRQGHELRYVTAWEMRRAVDAAAGGEGTPL